MQGWRRSTNLGHGEAGRAITVIWFALSHSTSGEGREGRGGVLLVVMWVRGRGGGEGEGEEAPGSLRLI